MPTAEPTKLLENVKNSLSQLIPEADLRDRDYRECGYHLEVRLVTRGMRRVAREMKDRRFYLETITAVDFLDYFHLIYYFTSYHEASFRVMARVKLPKDLRPFSVWDIYPEALWLEREVYDFFGIRFQGHPDLKRIINPGDVDYFPLLKNFGKTKFTTDIDDILC
jgi:NADH:ubiquinone oxidoreductase subunit C